MSSANALKRHRQTVHENLKHKTYAQDTCRFCKEVFGKRYQLRKHLLQVHQGGSKPTRTCQLCNLDFVLVGDFQKHIESHPDVFICTICGLSFQDKISFGLHQKSHKYIEKELRKFFCDLCPSRFISKGPLMVSVKTYR